MHPSANSKSEGLFGLRLIASQELFHISGSGKEKLMKKEDEDKVEEKIRVEEKKEVKMKKRRSENEEKKK